MKILLVDDSRTVSMLFSARLQSFDHEVVLAENGAIAVERFKESAPDLVLMDIEMPVMDGFAATSRIRQFEASQKWAWTPIIFLTSTSTPENFVTSVEAGGDDLIPKEIPEKVLRAKLKAMARVAALRQDLFGANQQMEKDIQARKKAEEELSRRYHELTALHQQLANMQAQIVQTEKLASLGQMAAGVAHEINTPLGFVFSNLGTLSKYYENLKNALLSYASNQSVADRESTRSRFDLDFIDEDIPALLGESREGIHRISQIIQNLKEFSQLDNNQEWRPFDLQQALDATLSLLGGQFANRVEIIKEYQDIPLVKCVPAQVNQVFVNLLTNAFQALPEKSGKIVVRTGKSDTNGVFIEIVDNGCGIAEEIKSRVFDPFFTTRPVGKGAGLGLSLSYGIMKNHQGRIEFESSEETGSCFRLFFPIN